MSGTPDDVRSVFAHWQATMGHAKAQLDDKRKKAIRAMLKLYSPDDLKAAITGCSLSPFHMGKNDQRQRYDGLHLILRDADHVDKFIAMAKDPGSAPAPQQSPQAPAYKLRIPKGA